MIPRRTAIAVIVFAALRDSGGLKAGTPLAIASTPVRATEPPANALRSRKRVRASVPGTIASGWGGSGAAVPPAIREKPIATIPRARAAKT